VSLPYFTVATSYSAGLGVTKEMMSQGPQVEHMKYREPDDQLSPH
jgi:hypothetical protein